MTTLAVVTVLLMASVGPFVGTVGAASGNTSSVSVTLADDGISSSTHPATWTNHNWTVTVDGSVDAELTHLELDYSGQDTTFEQMTASDVTVLVNGTETGTVSSVSTENAKQRLNVTFGTRPILDGNERIAVKTTGAGISNPSTAGSYTADITLYDGTSFATASTGFSITAGTYQGTVTNATSGSALEGASVIVQEDGNLVATATTDVNGQYSTPLGPGTYDVFVDRLHFENAFFIGVGLNASESKTVDAGLSPTGTIDGTVTDASNQPITGATVQLIADGSNSFYPATTDGTGAYAKEVATGTYDVTVDADGYVKATKTVSVGPNATVTTGFSMTEAVTITGIVRNEDGTPLAGMDVVAYDPASDTTADGTQTDGSGSYTLDVGAGTYDVIAFDMNGQYEDALAVGVSVSNGGTVTQDVTMSEAPPSGIVSGTVVGPNGNPVSGATVEAVDDTYTNFRQTTTDGSGMYSLSVPEGTYEVSAATAGYAEDVETGVVVSGGGTTSADLALSQAGYIEGTVTNANGAVQGAFVVADSGDRTLFAQTDASGHYRITAVPGETYRVSVFAQNQAAPAVTANPAAGATETAAFSLVKAEIKHSSVTVLDPAGVQTDKIGLSANVNQGMMMVQLLNESSNVPQGMPNELEGLGVDGSTEFEIDLTVTNYEPNTLLWGARNVTWSTSPNESVADGTDITIRASAVDLQGLNDPQTTIGPLMTRTPSDVQWPSGRNDRADQGWNRTVYFGLFDMATAPADVRDRFGGMTVTTNAQTFAPPKIVDGRLEVWVAGPHRTVDGTVHSGFYEATIPDRQLESWGVDPENAASDLEVMYQGKQQNFEVTDLADGIRLSLDIHYSAGTVAVSPSASAGSSSGGGGSSASTGTVVSTPTPSDGVAVIDRVAIDDPVVVTTEGIGAGGVAVIETTIAFDTGTNVDNEVQVSASVAPHDGIPVLPGASTLSYVTVDVVGTLEERDTGGSIAFSVDDDTLAERGAAPSHVQAYHYDEADGEWDAIATTHLGGDAFEAKTDEFSTFAVALDAPQSTTPESTPTAIPATETPVATAEPTTGDTPTAESTPTSGAEGPGFGTLSALFAVLALAAVALRRRE